jgi:hypothetical protein
MKGLLNRRGLRIVTGIVVLLVIAGLILLPRDQWSRKVSGLIQAIAIVSLVAVTVYYAMQTKELAREQKKVLREITNKRNIDFLERRLKEFYGPFLYNFDGIVNTIELGPNISIDAEKHFRSFLALVRDKEYMASEEIRKKIHEMIPALQRAHDYAYQDKEIKDKFLDLAKKLEKALSNEAEKIMDQIQEFYSVST